MAKAANPKAEDARKVIATNRRAFHDFHVLDKYECGLKLIGTEVKSLRAGHCVISDAYAMIDKKRNVAWLMNLQIPEWNGGNQINVHDPSRKRALLLNKRELLKLRQQMLEQGRTLVALSVYFKNGYAKVEIGVCKGKKLHDKRETLKAKQAQRDIARRVRN